MLMEQAGGLAIDGEGKRIMEKPPLAGIHDRSPISLGSRENINRLVELLNKN
jgi:fructose-1,6-bisphosphatase